MRSVSSIHCTLAADSLAAKLCPQHLVDRIAAELPDHGSCREARACEYVFLRDGPAFLVFNARLDRTNRARAAGYTRPPTADAVDSASLTSDQSSPLTWWTIALNSIATSPFAVSPRKL